MKIRNYRAGDEVSLREIYYHTIRRVNIQDYTAEQVKAWASDELDETMWREKIEGIRPYVVEHEGKLIGYADLQEDGYIDHFFCHYAWQRRGVGSLLMQKIHDEAHQRNIQRLYSNVSITAKPFFKAKGFEVVKEQSVLIRGQVLKNFNMQKHIHHISQSVTADR